VIPDITQMAVDLGTCDDRSSTRLEIFRAMSRERISLDLINISGDRLFFIIQDDHAPQAAALLDRMGLRYETREECAKVSCVGIGMKGTPGVMARIQEAFCDAGVEIMHSTDSHITICCLIRRADVNAAVKAVQEKFNL